MIEPAMRSLSMRLRGSRFDGMELVGALQRNEIEPHLILWSRGSRKVFDWPVEIFALVAAELLFLIVRSRDVVILFKSQAQRTTSEAAVVKRGLGRSLCLEMIIFVPASTGLLVLIAPAIIGERIACPVVSSYDRATYYRANDKQRTGSRIRFRIPFWFRGPPCSG
jgi:hypothetical protein